MDKNFGERKYEVGAYRRVVQQIVINSGAQHADDQRQDKNLPLFFEQIVDSKKIVTIQSKNSHNQKSLFGTGEYSRSRQIDTTTAMKTAIRNRLINFVTIRFVSIVSHSSSSLSFLL